MRFILLLVSCIFIFGCASNFVPPAVCDNQPSLILETFPHPEALDRGLLAMQLTAMETIKGYNASDAHAVIADIREAVSKAQGLTYAKVVGLISNKVQIANSLAGAVVFIVGPDIGKLAKPIPISPCDLELIKLHLNRQDALIDIMTGG